MPTRARPRGAARPAGHGRPSRPGLRRAPRSPFALAVTAALLGGCATPPGAGGCADDEHDPLEPVNRRVLAVNLALDRAVIEPVAKAYRAGLPAAVRDAIRAVVDNLKEPLVFANDLLQGRGHAAGITAGRFLLNSTVGFAGLVDRATGWGLPRQSGDFGQTLFAWGLGSGPYLVLPLFGPSNVRDGVGLGVDLVASPAGHVGADGVRREVSFATTAADGIDLRSRNIESFDELERSAFDLYAYLRSVTRQQRDAVLRQARPSAAEAPPVDELVDPEATPAPGAPCDPAP